MTHVVSGQPSSAIWELFIRRREKKVREDTITFIGIETICLLLRDGNNGRSDLAGEA